MKQLLLLMAICVIGDKLVCQKSLKLNFDSTLYKKVDSLIQLSETHLDKREFDKALELNTIAEKLAIDNKDTLSSIYGSVCFNHGNVLYQKGLDLKGAEHWYLKAKSIRERTLGKVNLDYATSLNNLAALYAKLGNYKEAEPLYLESIKIREILLGKEHPSYALSLNNLAIMYQDVGDFKKAETIHIQTIAIRELLGKENSDYATSINNLGSLYLQTGNFEKAEPLYLESMKIREKVFGKGHLSYALSLANLGQLYRKMRNYEKAESFYLEDIAIKEKVLGQEHPSYALSLNNLAVLYSKMRKFEKAEILYIKSMEVREKVLGKEHPEYAASLNNLAALYERMGNFQKAEPLYLQSLAIRKKTLGSEHPDYATSLNNIAFLFCKLDKFEKAESLYLESIEIRGKILGKEHPSYTASLENLAILYEKMGDFKKAVPLYEDAMNNMKMHISSALLHLSEKEMQQYLLTFEGAQAYIASAAQLMPKTSGISKLCFDNALFFKGFLLNAYNYNNHLENSDSAFVEKYQLLKSYGRQLAVEYAKPISKRTGVIELEEEYNTIEKTLTKINIDYEESMRQVNWKEVQNKLNTHEAAIEFIHYPFSNMNAIDSSLQKELMYAALVITPTISQPIFIPLFEEKSIDSLFNQYNELKSDYVNSLYTLNSRDVKTSEAKNRSLFELIWQPLEKELNGVKTIYYSKTGQLHRINMDAIPISETETLADKYQLINLNSTRQIVINNRLKKTNQQAILYGGIRYELDSLRNKEIPMLAQIKGDISFQMVDSKLRGGNWDYLAGTEREVNSIEKILQQIGVEVTLKKGYEATEESIKSIGSDDGGSPRILHMATHGYFFADTKKTELTSSNIRNEDLIFKMSDHPMLRSGLIMAGGNEAWQGQQQLEGREDGILTAYEISLMNLKNTELVVLSACETGLGDIQGNEGVYGLQRAFKIAGAKYLIMSLWQIPDRTTSILMTLFYKKWLEDKMSIPEAFQSAQKELRDKGIDPYKWAGFVLVE